ncbi:nucleotidyltransferase domain-containing protein [Candidatus Bipolaricaulota bacterium]|nr:nucleotidyltransferase domain-containing protein [Candidatus Bipolaricaulota bacterium]
MTTPQGSGALSVLVEIVAFARGVDIEGHTPTIEGVMPTIEGHTPTKSLIETLFPKARIAVLSELSKAEDTGLHLREIARRSGLNSKSVLREVHALRNADVLTAQQIGRQIIYRLNPDCPIYDELRSIIRKTVGLAGVLRGALEPLQDRIEFAYIYGSYATGTERPDSDVDLMVVGGLTLRELSSPIREAGRMIQRTVNPTLYSPREYAEELNDDNSFVSRVHHGVRINLIRGKS